MTASSKRFSRFIGCDVGKASVVAFDSHTGKTTILANQPKALAAFAAALDATCLVVCEATGGYEGGQLNATLQAGIAAHRADARKVKFFIRSFGILGKSDANDAHALARYRAERQGSLALWQAPTPFWFATEPAGTSEAARCKSPPISRCSPCRPIAPT